MATLVIESFPESLHARLEHAAAHRRSVPQETIHLLEKALAAPPDVPARSGLYYWSTRRLVSSLEAALQSVSPRHAIDSTVLISDERDAR